MNVIRQNDSCLYLKRVLLFDVNKCLSQQQDIFCVIKNRFTVFSHLCKKITTTALVGSSILHLRSLKFSSLEKCWVTKLVALTSNPTYGAAIVGRVRRAAA